MSARPLPRHKTPPPGYRRDAVELPNNCWLQPGGRVRISRSQLDAALAADPSIAVESGSSSHESVVVFRPWTEELA